LRTGVAKTRFTAWLGKQHVRLGYVEWLVGQGPNPSLRALRLPVCSQIVQFSRHAWRARFHVPRRIHVPAPPIAKVCAIRGHARRYGLRLFIETGTCFGDTTAAVAGSFDKCWTVELSKELYARAARRFAGTNVECLHGDSGTELPKIIGGLSAPALFWLDAHATGGSLTADAGHDPILLEVEAVVSSPLRHVALIDDARGHNFEEIRRVAGSRRCSMRNDIIRIEPA
jgi:hypothetical protein